MLWFPWPFLKRKMKCACTLGSRVPATFSESAELSCACHIFRREKFAEPTRFADFALWSPHAPWSVQWTNRPHGASILEFFWPKEGLIDHVCCPRLGFYNWFDPSPPSGKIGRRHLPGREGSAINRCIPCSLVCLFFFSERRAVRITSWYPKSNGSHLKMILACQPALSTEWLGWVAIWCEVWRMHRPHNAPVSAPGKTWRV